MRKKEHSKQGYLLIKEVKPDVWYSLPELQKIGIGQMHLSYIQEDNHQILLHTMFNKTAYLGASILNAGMRRKIVRAEIAQPKVRYMSPVRFAECVEIPAAKLITIKHKKETLVQKVTIADNDEQVIDLAYLHNFSIDNVKHKVDSLKSLKKIVNKYKISGGHSDYFEMALTKIDTLKGNILRNYMEFQDNEHFFNVEDLSRIIDQELAKTIPRFDSSRDITPSTFFLPRLKGVVQDFLRGQDTLSRSERVYLKKGATFYEEYFQKNGYPPTQFQIAEALGISQEQYSITLLRSKGIKVRLDTEINNKNNNHKNRLMSDLELPIDLENPLNNRLISKRTVEEQKKSEELAKALRYLLPDEQEVIRYYYFDNKNLKEIGAKLSISESRVSQIHTRSIAKLKDIITDTLAS